jgi:hypothetical protein
MFLLKLKMLLSNFIQIKYLDCFKTVIPFLWIGLVKDLSETIFSELQSDITIYTSLSDILISGDFNARTGSLADFIQNDSINDNFIDCPKLKMLLSNFIQIKYVYYFKTVMPSLWIGLVNINIPSEGLPLFSTRDKGCFFSIYL